MKLASFSKRQILIALGLLLLLGAAAAWWIQRGDTRPQFREYPVSRGPVELVVQATGLVQPRNRLEIKPPLPGRAEDVLVREGMLVQKGQLLLWMSSSERAALLDAARARGPEEVRRWEELYRATPLIAPITGTVIARKVEPGQVFTGNDALLVIADRLLVEAQVDETDIAKIKLKQPGRIVLDAYPETEIHGQVAAVAFEAKTVNNVTTYTVEVLPQRVPDFMRSGMTANVYFVLEARPDVLRIPVLAVRREGAAQRVLVRAAAGTEEEREVTLGLNDGKFAEVVAGLAEGDVVLVSALKGGKGGAGAKATNPFAPTHRSR